MYNILSIHTYIYIYIYIYNSIYIYIYYSIYIIPYTNKFDIVVWEGPASDLAG